MDVDPVVSVQGYIGPKFMFSMSFWTYLRYQRWGAGSRSTTAFVQPFFPVLLDHAPLFSDSVSSKNLQTAYFGDNLHHSPLHHIDTYHGVFNNDR